MQKNHQPSEKYQGRGHKNGFQYVAFLPYKLVFTPHFLHNCGIHESIRTTTCHKAVVVNKQGHTPCKIHMLQQSPSSVEFHGDHETAIKWR